LQRPVPASAGAERRCRAPVPSAGAERWCRALVPSAGAERRCRAPVPSAGAERWCRALVPSAGELNSTKIDARPPEAPALCVNDEWYVLKP